MPAFPEPKPEKSKGSVAPFLVRAEAFSPFFSSWVFRMKGGGGEQAGVGVSKSPALAYSSD